MCLYQGCSGFTPGSDCMLRYLHCIIWILQTWGSLADIETIMHGGNGSNISKTDNDTYKRPMQESETKEWGQVILYSLCLSLNRMILLDLQLIVSLKCCPILAPEKSNELVCMACCSNTSKGEGFHACFKWQHSKAVWKPILILGHSYVEHRCCGLV